MSRISFAVLSLLLLSLFYSCDKKTTGVISTEQKSRFQLARKKYYGGDRKTALSLSGKIRQESPGFSENNCLYARALYYDGRKEEASLIWEEILKQEKYYIDVIKKLSRYYIAAGRAAEAENLIMRGLTRSSEDPALLYLLAESRLGQDDLSDALSLLIQADILMERQCEIYLKQASLYQSYGYYKEALSAIKKGRALLSDDHTLVPAIEALQNRLEDEISP